MSYIQQEQREFVNFTRTVPSNEKAQSFISYTNEPQILKDDYLLKKVERPEAYQFWHQKTKNESDFSRVLQTNYRLGIPTTSEEPAQEYIQQGPIYQTTQQVLLNIQLVSKEEIEQPWRQDCMYLQSVVAQLEKQTKTETKVVVTEDKDKISSLERELQLLRAQLNRNPDFSQEDQILRDLSNQLQNAQQQIYQLETQESSSTTEQVSKLQDEAGIWKKKFINVNHDYNETLERLKMAEAEIDALKKETTSKSVRTVVSTRTTNQSSSAVRSSGQQKSPARQEEMFR